MSPIAWILRGDNWRVSRFHDMRGNFIGWRTAVRDAPRCLVEVVWRELAKQYPCAPWIPYPAIRAMERLTTPDMEVLDHGAGMSTVWWARRVRYVYAIESSVVWYQKVKAEITRRRLKNVGLELRSGDTYSDLSDIPDGSYDLVSIDGHDRHIVVAHAVRIVRRPGWIYLDNTDFAHVWHEMYGEAEQMLLELARREGADVTYFTGLLPATFIAGQGMLVHFPG